MITCDQCGAKISGAGTMFIEWPTASPKKQFKGKRHYCCAKCLTASAQGDLTEEAVVAALLDIREAEAKPTRLVIEPDSNGKSHR